MGSGGRARKRGALSGAEGLHRVPVGPGGGAGNQG